MNPNTLLDFAKGGALGLWIGGPLMFVVGVIGGYMELIVMGPVTFVAGAWILWDAGRR